jgi:hypothetical protein
MEGNEANPPSSATPSLRVTRARNPRIQEIIPDFSVSMAVLENVANVSNQHSEPPVDEGSITRCVCGDNEDQEGFMIQCDKCHVWQHGDCVGILGEHDSPEKYFCEECAPDLPLHKRMKEIRLQLQLNRQVNIFLNLA